MNSLPRTSAINLKAQHYQQLLDNNTLLDWFEIHPENYMGDGGAPHYYLTKLRENHELSMHGVGMSLGSADGIGETHLKRLKKLVDRYEPQAVSEHLSWSHWNATYLNDLLPLPYTHESLGVVCRNIDRVQNFLGRQILVENPSTYLAFAKNDYSETDFFTELVKRSGCACLLDINNVFVSAFNNDYCPYEYLKNFPVFSVTEIHLAGHSLKRLDGDKHIRIDDHGSPVKEEVWSLYRAFFQQARRPVATLIEWDTDVPELDTLMTESHYAQNEMRQALGIA